MSSDYEVARLAAHDQVEAHRRYGLSVDRDRERLWLILGTGFVAIMGVLGRGVLLSEGMPALAVDAYTATMLLTAVIGFHLLNAQMRRAFLVRLNGDKTDIEDPA